MSVLRSILIVAVCCLLAVPASSRPRQPLVTGNRASASTEASGSPASAQRAQAVNQTVHVTDQTSQRQAGGPARPRRSHAFLRGVGHGILRAGDVARQIVLLPLQAAVLGGFFVFLGICSATK